MKTEKYSLKTNSIFMTFEFKSIGPKGEIIKIVQFTETEQKGYYNLGFGDKNQETGEINDVINTNNGDVKKVLATVILTVYLFSEKYPEAWIYIKGSNSVRTRLYKIGISNNLLEIKKDFIVFGLKDTLWLEFSEGINFEAFLVQRKKH